MAESNVFSFDPLDFGDILSQLLRKETITNINCWYGRIIVSDNIKGEYVYDLNSHSREEIDEFYDVISKLPNRLANRMVISYNEGSPIIDAETEYNDIGRLRVNVIHPCLNGSNYPAISIRKALMKVRITKEDMINSNYVSEEILYLIKALIEGGNNIMIAGITGSGKTELLRYIARYIKDNEAIITIEDTREAYLEQNYPNKYVMALKSTEEQGFSELIRACLRQNPRWICVSETRSEEVLDLLNATETGHKLISTIHADSAKAIPSRMVSMAKAKDGSEATRIYKQVYENLDIGIYIYYYSDNSGSHRMIAEICEFFLDETNKTRSHVISEYDFINNKYIYNNIESNKIKQNFIKGRVDTTKLKGVFLNA